MATDQTMPKFTPPGPLRRFLMSPKVDLGTIRGIDYSIAGLCLLILVALLSRAISPSLLRDLNPWPDSVEYALSARNILERGQFVITINGRDLPSRYSVGFPLLIVPTYLLFGVRYTNGIFAVLAFDLLSIAMVYAVARRLFGRIAGLVAAFAVVSSTLDQSLAQLILSDVPASGMVLAGILALVFSGPHRPDDLRADIPRSQRSKALIGLAGLSLGYACWIRQIDVAYLPSFCLFLLVSSHSKALRWNENIGRWTVLSAPLIGGWLPLQLAVLVYNLFTFGSPTRTGYNLWTPTWFDVPGRAFSLHYAFGPSAHAVGYLKALTGLPVSTMGSPPTLLLYPPWVMAFAALAVVVTVRSVGLPGCPWRKGNAVHRKAESMPGALRLSFVTLAVGLVASTYLVYVAYFVFDPRFLHLCLLIVAVLAGGGVALSASWLRAKFSRPGGIATVLKLVIVIVVFVPVSLSLVETVTSGNWWRSVVLNENLDNQSEYYYLKLVAEHSATDAFVISDVPPVLFSAYEIGSDRTIIPATDPLIVGHLLHLHSFKSDPSAVARLVASGAPVYYIGDPAEFMSFAATSRTGLNIVVAAHAEMRGSVIYLYRLVLSK